MKYKIADLIVEFNPKFKMLKDRAKKYEIDGLKPDYVLHVDNEHIENEKKRFPMATDEDAEYMVMGTTFYQVLLNHQGCLLHSSAVVVDDESYLFSANCGTGKSTHTSLWLKYLADKKPYILNDDKPAIRILEDGIYSYGTPFSGKHDINENKKAKLKGICFLEQSESNFIEKIEPKEAVKLFFEQTIRKLNQEEMLKFFDILDKILKEIPIYKLHCNISEEAVQLSYRTMKGENTNES